MKECGVHYRAWLEYQARVKDDKNIQKMCEAIKNASTDYDFSESVRTYCTIESDWIEIIEKGLVHVEKAIREERQFIRKEGEVVPIEKLKRVSTATVQHLARHSNLITKEPPEGEDLIPEKLYMAENFSDYAVYENRFLYMLLCYLRDFINLRLDKIQETGRTYRVQTEVNKNVRVGKKYVKYTTSLYYEDKNDSRADEFFPSSELIERIETAQRLVVSLLMTPLMKEVSKAPMLTPPITRTNVLRMNVNFKAALEMYGKLVAYNKPGYVIHEINNNFRPLPDAMLAEYASAIGVETYLSYKYGNNLSEQLRLELERKKEEERSEQIKERASKLEALKKHASLSGKSLDEYILLMQEQIDALFKDRSELNLAKKEIENLNEKIDSRNNTIKQLNAQNQELLETVQQKNEQLALQKQEFEDQKQQIQKECEQTVKNAENACNERIVEMKTQLAEESEKFAQKQRLLSAIAENEKKDRIFIQAQLHGLRQQHGLNTDLDDYTSEQRFKELESEFKAFEDFFGKEWKKTKKRIRKENLWSLPKKQKSVNDESNEVDTDQAKNEQVELDTQKVKAEQIINQAEVSVKPQETEE